MTPYFQGLKEVGIDIVAGYRGLPIRDKFAVAGAVVGGIAGLGVITAMKHLLPGEDPEAIGVAAALPLGVGVVGGYYLGKAIGIGVEHSIDFFKRSRRYDQTLDC